MTIYTDVAGNKYLGDCRWGNHDINYPTIDYLIAQDNLLDYVAWRTAVQSLFTEANYTINSIDTSTGTTPPNSTIFDVKPPSSGIGFVVRKTSSGMRLDIGAMSNLLISHPYRHPWTNWDGNAVISPDCVAVAGSSSYSQITWLTKRVPDLGGQIRPESRPLFFWVGQLSDVNPSFNYYTPNENKVITIVIGGNDNNQNPYVSEISSNFFGEPRYILHYIASVNKNPLETGRANYTISCSDGQTPGSQWATDMWVYDNNVDLGYPVIGRVPNMLLGIGDYTYLKPVKIGGSVFPDNGSPWYLPVGTFSGKVLLMRCYSSM